MKGKTIINKISDGWSLLFKQWHVTVSLACIVPRTSIQTHNSEISFVCVCLRVWMTDHSASDAVKKRSKEAAQLGRKMWTQVNRYKELLAKVFGKSWWWDFFWGSCNVIDNLLFYQFPVYLYLLFCLQYIILSAGAATLHTPSCWTEVRVRLWACHWWMCRSCQNNTKCKPVDRFLHCYFFLTDKNVHFFERYIFCTTRWRTDTGLATAVSSKMKITASSGKIQFAHLCLFMNQTSVVWGRKFRLFDFLQAELSSAVMGLFLPVRTAYIWKTLLHKTFTLRRRV